MRKMENKNQKSRKDDNFSNTKLKGVKILLGALLALQLIFFIKNSITKTQDSLPGVTVASAQNYTYTDTLSNKKKPIFGFKDTVKKKPPFICNLNRADSANLVKLYGIGGYYAKKILRYRESLGGSFVTAEQLLEIDGFTQERFDNIKDKLKISKSDIIFFNFEEADIKFLEKHPYIGAYAARGIKKYIEVKKNKGDTTKVTPLELADNNIITRSNALRLEYYVK